MQQKHRTKLFLTYAASMTVFSAHKIIQVVVGSK